MKGGCGVLRLCGGGEMELEDENFPLAYRVEERAVLYHDVALIFCLLLFLLLWGLLKLHIDEGPTAPRNAHDGYELS